MLKLRNPLSENDLVTLVHLITFPYLRKTRLTELKFKSVMRGDCVLTVAVRVIRLIHVQNQKTPRGCGKTKLTTPS